MSGRTTRSRATKAPTTAIDAKEDAECTRFKRRQPSLQCIRAIPLLAQSGPPKFSQQQACMSDTDHLLPPSENSPALAAHLGLGATPGVVMAKPSLTDPPAAAPKAKKTVLGATNTKPASSVKADVVAAGKKPTGQKQASRDSVKGGDDVKSSPLSVSRVQPGVGAGVLSDGTNRGSAGAMKPPVVPVEMDVDRRTTRGRGVVVASVSEQAKPSVRSTRSQRSAGVGVVAGEGEETKRAREDSSEERGAASSEPLQSVHGRPRSSSTGSVSEMVQSMSIQKPVEDQMVEVVGAEKEAQEKDEEEGNGRTRRGKPKAAAPAASSRPVRVKAKTAPTDSPDPVVEPQTTEPTPMEATPAAPVSPVFIAPIVPVLDRAEPDPSRTPPRVKAGRGGRGRGRAAAGPRAVAPEIPTSSPQRPTDNSPASTASNSPSGGRVGVDVVGPSMATTAILSAMSTLNVEVAAGEELRGNRHMGAFAEVVLPPVRTKVQRPTVKGVPGIYMVGSLDNVGFPVGEDVFGLKCFTRVEKLPEKVKWVAAGSQHGLVVSEDGKTVWSFGNNDEGALGRTTESSMDEQMPHPVEKLEGKIIKKTECCDSMSVFLMEDGTVYSCGTFKNMDGENHYTQAIDRQPLPAMVEGFSEPVIDIACGANFVLAVTKSGQLFAWGEGKHGQLGHEQRTRTQVNTWKPYRLGVTLSKSDTPSGKSKPAHFVSVFAGPDTAFAIDDDGMVHAFGSNNWGQLGVGNTEIVHPLPTLVRAASTTEVVKRGAIPPIVPLRPVKAVASGNFHTVFQMENGDLLATGKNVEWQLGQGRDGAAAGTRLSPLPVRIPKGVGMASVACGMDHCVAVDREGGVWTWGEGEAYMLGHGRGVGEPEPARCKWVAKAKEVCEGKACWMEGMKVRWAVAGAHFTMVVAEVE
ncbi:hypothetical protein HDU67_009696 [Dinochytrium kinnereticum]|nr:hypothetical protein HDU67_009696 [Dinochytrium kinnereticum]